MKLQINLPQFDGFYNSVFDDIFEVSDDLQSYGDVTAEEYESIDWVKVHNSIGKEYAENFWEQNERFLKEVGIKSLKFVKIDSPREYNFRTDYLVVEVDFNLSIFRRFVKNAANEHKTIFETYIKENYSSYDGFISFYSSEVSTWLKDYLTTDKKLATDNVIFEGFLTFILMFCDGADYDKESLVYKTLENTYQCLHFLPETV